MDGGGICPCIDARFHPQIGRLDSGPFNGTNNRQVQFPGGIGHGWQWRPERLDNDSLDYLGLRAAWFWIWTLYNLWQRTAAGRLLGNQRTGRQQAGDN